MVTFSNTTTKSVKTRHLLTWKIHERKEEIIFLMQKTILKFIFTIGDFNASKWKFETTLLRGSNLFKDRCSFIFYLLGANSGNLPIRNDLCVFGSREVKKSCDSQILTNLDSFPQRVRSVLIPPLCNSFHADLRPVWTWCSTLEATYESYWPWTAASREPGSRPPLHAPNNEDDSLY